MCLIYSKLLVIYHFAAFSVLLKISSYRSMLQKLIIPTGEMFMYLDVKLP